MDRKLPKVKLIFNSYKTTTNQLAFTFDQNLMNRLTSKLNPTGAMEECHLDNFKSDSLKVPKLLFFDFH